MVDRLAALVGRSTPHYVPSWLESMWANHSEPGLVNCTIARRQARSVDVRNWLRYSERHVSGADPQRPSLSELRALSRFINASTGCSEPIEPLIGVARHPYAKGSGCWIAKYSGKVREMTDITYLIIANHCGALDATGCLPIGGGTTLPAHKQPANRQQQQPRRLLFDLGCSDYGMSTGTIERYAKMRAAVRNVSIDVTRQEIFDRQENQTAHSNNALGPSIPTLRAMYKKNCLEFDHVWAWEARKMGLRADGSSKWWDRVPEGAKSRLTFYNEPVNMSDASALGVLKREARPEDFVAFKLDIDSPELELEVMRTIANDQGYAELIDELFFEYHMVGSSDVNGLGTYWNRFSAKGQPKAPPGQPEAVALLSQLRQQGIRAHFWV